MAHGQLIELLLVFDVSHLLVSARIGAVKPRDFFDGRRTLRVVLVNRECKVNSIFVPGWAIGWVTGWDARLRQQRRGQRDDLDECEIRSGYLHKLYATLSAAIASAARRLI